MFFLALLLLSKLFYCQMDELNQPVGPWGIWSMGKRAFLLLLGLLKQAAFSSFLLYFSPSIMNRSSSIEGLGEEGRGRFPT